MKSQVCIYVCGNWQADTKMYAEMPKAKNCWVCLQEKQTGKTYMTRFKDLL